MPAPTRMLARRKCGFRHCRHAPPASSVPVFAAPPTGRLSVGDAKAACAVSLKEWRPNGEQVTEVLSADGVTAVLEKWHGALDVAAVAEKVGGGSGDVLPWATWRASLVMAYAQAKEAELEAERQAACSL